MITMAANATTMRASAARYWNTSRQSVETSWANRMVPGREWRVRLGRFVDMLGVTAPPL
jgi:hypothetical protein